MRKEGLIAYFPKITPARYNTLLRVFSSLEVAWVAQQKDFIHTKWSEELIQEFFVWKNSINEHALEQELQEHQITLVSQADPLYPPLLKQIPDPPISLFVKGNINSLQLSIAVVGTRNPTPYGVRIAKQLARALVDAQFTLVSGLAIGIDTLVHEQAVITGKPTIAVLGGGIDTNTISPHRNRTLAKNIIATGGAIVSEYPPFTLPTKYSFPRRNRIIAGLTKATLVIEAGLGSGALITAKSALDYNREVLAIPHPIDAQRGEGTNDLIKAGATVITSIGDILDLYQLQKTSQSDTNNPILDLNQAEKQLLSFLTEPTTVDALIKKTGLKSHQLLPTLTTLELKQCIIQSAGLIQKTS